MEDYNKLDITAKLFPSVTSKNNSSVFRVSVVLNEEIDPDTLQLAVNMIYERFSLFFLRLRRGVFWNYFDRNHIYFKVEEDLNSPCDNIIKFENKGYIIKVLYYKNRVSVEAFHSITDGNGILEYIKSLIYYYICIKHGNIDPQGKVLLFDEKDKNDEDSFLRHYSRKTYNRRKTITREGFSFRLKGKQYKHSGHSVVTGVISVARLKECSKEYNCTITAFLIAYLIKAIYNEKQSKTGNKKPIVIAVPVNLRKIFASKTLKNFFGIVNISYKMSPDTKIENLLASVTDQLKLSSNQDYLEDMFVKNIKRSNNVLAMNTPLIIKNIFIPLGFRFIGELRKTITLTNLGKVDFPDGIKQYVECAEVLLYPTQKSPINCGVCSFEDKLCFSFTRSITDASIARAFFTSLTLALGQNVAVYSNNWGEVNEKVQQL